MSMPSRGFLVTISVDSVAIAARAHVRARQEIPGVDIWVELDGLDRRESAVAVRTAQSAEGIPEDASPTSGGTYVVLWKDWARRLAALAAQLERQGRTGRITVPPITEMLWAEPRVPYPTALLAHRLNPPIRLGPFNDFGAAEVRWGVEDELSLDLDQAVAEWVFTDGPGYIGGLLRSPATKEDAADQVADLRASGGRGFRLRAGPRQVSYDIWGASIWTQADPSRPQVTLVTELMEVLRRFAGVLEVGFIRPAVITAYDCADLAQPHWCRRPWLWNARVPDAHGIQLLTGAHLERAQDLSNWHVTRVEQDRWLVQARDLTPWYDGADDMSMQRGEFPDPHLLADARADFGDMILTRENDEKP